jgi:ribonuclease HI
MELYAALDAINDHFTEEEITIVSDSAYLVNCFGERWWVKWLQNGWLGSTTNKEITNRDIWEPLLELVMQHGRIRFEKVKAHSGVYGNEKVDQMALREVQAQYGEATSKEDKGREGDGVHPGDGDAPGVPSSGVDEAEDARDPESVPGG